MDQGTVMVQGSHYKAPLYISLTAINLSVFFPETRWIRDDMPCYLNRDDVYLYCTWYVRSATDYGVLRTICRVVCYGVHTK